LDFVKLRNDVNALYLNCYAKPLSTLKTKCSNPCSLSYFFDSKNNWRKKHV